MERVLQFPGRARYGSPDAELLVQRGLRRIGPGLALRRNAREAHGRIFDAARSAKAPRACRPDPEAGLRLSAAYSARAIPAAHHHPQERAGCAAGQSGGLLEYPQDVSFEAEA